MHTRETIDQAIEAKAETFLPENETAGNYEYNVYAAQYQMVQRLTANRTNMKDNRRRTQILAGHNKIIQVINGFKF